MFVCVVSVVICNHCCLGRVSSSIIALVLLDIIVLVISANKTNIPIKQKLVCHRHSLTPSVHQAHDVWMEGAEDDRELQRCLCAWSTHALRGRDGDGHQLRLLCDTVEVGDPRQGLLFLTLLLSLQNLHVHL